MPTLYEWAGGEQAFERLINAFYDRVEHDELLAPLFGGRSPRSTASTSSPGGPRSSAARRATREQLGGYDHMVAKHRDLAITPEQRFRFASLMSLAADDAGLPDDPEFRSAFVAYVEWGTRLALHNSQPGAEVAEHAPVPRWGWGEAPPYQP